MRLIRDAYVPEDARYAVVYENAGDRYYAAFYTGFPGERTMFEVDQSNPTTTKPLDVMDQRNEHIKQYLANCLGQRGSEPRERFNKIAGLVSWGYRIWTHKAVLEAYTHMFTWTKDGLDLVRHEERVLH